MSTTDTTTPAQDGWTWQKEAKAAIERAARCIDEGNDDRAIAYLSYARLVIKEHRIPA